MIVEQTNLIATQYLEANPNLGSHTLAELWKNVTSDAIKKFLVLCLLMVIVQKPSIYLYWSQDPLLKVSIFNAVMSGNLFQGTFALFYFEEMRQTLQDQTSNRIYSGPIQKCLYSRKISFHW